MSALPSLTLDEITEQGINPALRLLPARLDSPEARVMLLAIALQESGLRDRRQLITVRRGNQLLTVAEGPAKSFWQAERGGGMVHGVRTHPTSKVLAAQLYALRAVRPQDVAIWKAIEQDDVLAAGLARLLLLTDPYRLPALGHSQAAWELYIRTWRPGKPRRNEWDGYYQRALAFVTGQEA